MPVKLEASIAACLRMITAPTSEQPMLTFLALPMLILLVAFLLGSVIVAIQKRTHRNDRLSTSGPQATGSKQAASSFAAPMVGFSELMANNMLPQLILPNGATSAIWAWTTANRGIFTITIPAGIDGRGTLSVTAGVDTSGLVQAATWDAPLQ